jgi:type II secretory pathway pseudopilin PulG
MNKLLITSLALGTIALSGLPTFAQNSGQSVEQQTQADTITYRNSLANLNRAKNYARQAAEERNGGLQYYRAEALMHGPVEQTRFVENGDGTVTFTFYGGAPAAPPTIESVVTVAIDGWQTTVDYNGPIRSR